MSAAKPSRPFELLLVEDDPGDVLLTREAFRPWLESVRLEVVEDGDKAMAYLRREPPFAHAPRPDLILLDLNLPRKDGREVLAEIKSSPDLRSTPVIVLTTSDSARDVRAAYDSCANAYLAKPLGMDEFAAMAKLVREFWLGLAKLPTR